MGLVEFVECLILVAGFVLTVVNTLVAVILEPDLEYQRYYLINALCWSIVFVYMAHRLFL